MTKESVMKTIPIADARRRFAELIDAAERGEQFTLTRHGRPVAVIGPAHEVEFTAAEDKAEYAASLSLDAQFTSPERLFASPAIRAVLSQFVLHPDREFYQRDIARRAGVALRSAQLALERLERLGLIHSYRSGNRIHYLAVPSQAFESLRRWALPEVSLVPLLREALAPLGEGVEMAFVYGSTASGQDTATSDIDLMVVGHGDESELYESLRPVQDALGRELNATYYDAEEFRQRISEGAHFVSSVLRGPVLWVIGRERLGRYER